MHVYAIPAFQMLQEGDSKIGIGRINLQQIEETQSQPYSREREREREREIARADLVD